MVDHVASPQPNGSRKPRRHGIVLVAVMACLAVASMIFISVVKTAALGHRATQSDARQVQAAWLAESGLERAAWQLANDADYAGETWTLSADELAGPHDAVVEIEVEAVAEQPDQRLVRVRADYPNHPRHRARCSKQVLVQLPSAESPEQEADETAAEPPT